MAQEMNNRVHLVNQLNAFFTVPRSKFTKSILTKNRVLFFERDDQYFIIGNSSEDFANMFNTNTRRPMHQGIVSSQEHQSVTIMESIIDTLVKKPKKFGEVICFSVPGAPLFSRSYVMGHESILKMYLGKLGYTPISVNEGLAVVMAELAEQNFTGIGISMGGGMCNVCLSYLSVPVLTYSVQVGGDYIDASVSEDIKLSATHIKVYKEESLSLSALPKNNMETALHMYYIELITALAKSLEKAFAKTGGLPMTGDVPKVFSALPIVISGGTAMPEGFKDKFVDALDDIELPFEISSVRVADDPLNSTAKGALIMALSEE